MCRGNTSDYHIIRYLRFMIRERENKWILPKWNFTEFVFSVFDSNETRFTIMHICTRSNNVLRFTNRFFSTQRHNTSRELWHNGKIMSTLNNKKVKICSFVVWPISRGSWVQIPARTTEFFEKLVRNQNRIASSFEPRRWRKTSWGKFHSLHSKSTMAQAFWFRKGVLCSAVRRT